MTNKVADILLAYLETKHARVYRNFAKKDAVFPYVVFNVETVMDTYPTNDFYCYVQVYDKPNVSVRTINDIADSIDAINHTIINNSEMNLHFTRVNRQFVSNAELTDSQMVDLQYAVRAYGKE